MTIIWRTTGAWGVGKGAALTAAEFDGNFYDVDQRVTDLENNPPVANSISSITKSGSTFTVWLQDGTALGPFNLPVATFSFRGEWAASEAYFENDWFTYERAGLYRVAADHVSASAFDAGAGDTAQDYYQLLLELFSGSQVKEVATTTYDPVLLDANRYLRCTNASGCAVLIPTNANVAFPIGTELHFRQTTSGAVVIDGDTGVTINPSRPDYDTATPWLGASATIKKVDDNEWDYIGPGTEPTA
jgi:hypothetical protein